MKSPLSMASGAPLLRHASALLDVAEHPRPGGNDDAIVGEDGIDQHALDVLTDALDDHRRSTATRNGVPSSTTSRNDESLDCADAGGVAQSAAANRIRPDTSAHAATAARQPARGLNA